jgi:hypothetical protein
MKRFVLLALVCAILVAPASALAAQARAAIIKQEGITFAVVHVPASAVQSDAVANRTIKAYESYFDVPVVLMYDDSKRTRWFGRNDIVDFISDYSFGDLPWKIYNLD